TVFARPLNGVDQFAFVIGLHEINIDADFGSESAQVGFDLAQRDAAVDRWLAAAEKIEVGTIENQDPLHRSSSWSQRRKALKSPVASVAAGGGWYKASNSASRTAPG